MFILIMLIFTTISLMSFDDARQEKERKQEYEYYEKICRGDTTKTAKPK